METSAGIERLPRGRHHLSRELVARNQRERLIAAIAELVHERGYEKTTVAVLSKRAGVSKGDFYKQFGNKLACLVAAYDLGVERLRERVLAACAGHGDWAQGVCAALAALLAHLAGEPAQARLLLVEGLRGGRDVYDHYQEALQGFVPHLRDGAPALFDGRRPPEAADEAVVGGIASLLGRRVLAGEAERLEGFFPEVAEFALTPYLGPAEARRIISER